MPKRSISPESFDAILSELGDDPAIGHPKRSTSSLPESPTMNQHPFTSMAHLACNGRLHGGGHTTKQLLVI